MTAPRPKLDLSTDKVTIEDFDANLMVLANEVAVHAISLKSAAQFPMKVDSLKVLTQLKGVLNRTPEDDEPDDGMAGLRDDLLAEQRDEPNPPESDANPTDASPPESHPEGE